ncbi:unnamed protein product [Leptosia nina]|uniref:Uncharacterized protein n=1 Tax=Leptosia nina TaxID=320188 RepID=A0AAV1JBG8_9NEOP
MEYDTSQPAPPGVISPSPLNKESSTPKTTSSFVPTILPTTKGVENAKKRLRAFSIQKKAPLTPVMAPKPTGSGNTMVLIGKLSGVKVTPKREEEQDAKIPKLPKPPKPGAVRKALQGSYNELQKQTLAEIEDMKRKMELVDLGIPLGLICPSSTSDKAMPTKSMPPIKSFIDPAKVDEIIREAKKAKLEGKEFKFDYHKLLPGYDNPFQRKKDDKDKEEKHRDKKYNRRRGDFRDKRDKHSKRYSDHKKHDKNRDHDKEKSRDKGGEHKVELTHTEKPEGDVKETDVAFGDYLVCDSWSLDNDEKTSTSSPKYDDKTDSQCSVVPEVRASKEPSELLKDSMNKKNEIIKSITTEKPKPIKLQPVIDSFKYEIDDNDEEVLDIFDAKTDLNKFATVKAKKLTLYDSPDHKSIDLDDSSKDLSLDGINDDTFLESVINEIKVGEISDEESQDKGLVEYEMSPSKGPANESISQSVTPELAHQTARKNIDYSDGYRSNESGYKTSDTVESGYKSGAEFRLSIEKDLDDALNASKMPQATMDSLETWTFVLKICQPLLFRHDKNKCYKETRASPKLWYTTNPKCCPCVKDRSVVYEELEMCKMNLVDRVYGCDQISDESFPKCRDWYPQSSACLVETGKVQLSSEWEADDSQQSIREESRRAETPKREELALDREYQRFMEAVWPEVNETQKESPRSTTPVQENRKKRKENSIQREEEKRAKKMKLSSEGWSQESEVEEDDRSKKVKSDKGKARKRKHSTSASSSHSDSEEDSKRKKRALKKKAMKKVKSKSAKRRRMGKKLLKKLKEKQKKNKKLKKDLSDDDTESDKSKKSKKKKVEKAKKRDKKKKKAKKASSTDTSSSSSSDSEIERKRSKKKKDKSKKRTKSSSESQNEELFDVTILNNIKTEKTTDDEGQKLMDFSPRRQKPREIINVKELQNDFVGNTHIKEEINETREESNKVETAPEIVEESLSPEPEHSKKEKSAEDTRKPVEAVKPPLDDNSQCSSQESIYSAKHEDLQSNDALGPSYEKDESHLRPSSQNSNYSFKDVMSANQSLYKEPGSSADCDKFENYEPAEYEVYEHLAMAYQSDVAKQPTSPSPGAVSRIETVVRARSCGEIKCDWRAGHSPTETTPHRPSRWGLKPGEVNIVLTGGEVYRQSPQPVYRIQNLANRNDTSTPISYDEAYLDTYGASDRLQYGDCFAAEFKPTPSEPAPTTAAPKEDRVSSLDDRINQALRGSVLGDVTKELEGDNDQDAVDRGHLPREARAAAKRVRFADGYTPGQDSDTEPPPNKKRFRVRRLGCAWPCPASHPDHVSLWDALPPPPPPPGSPPPRRKLISRIHTVSDPLVGLAPTAFMPPEPPPGLIALH